MLALLRTLTVATARTDQLAVDRSTLARSRYWRPALALADQVLVSGASFATTMLIGRACLPAELGLYTLAFSLFVLLLNVPKSLIWVPLTTFTPSMPPSERKQYLASLLVGQLVVAAALAAVVSTVGLALVATIGLATLGSILAVFGPVLALLLIREHARQVCFARLGAGEALAIDLAVCVLQVGGIAALALAGELSAARAFLVIGAANLPVVLVWLLGERGAFQVTRHELRAAARKNLHFGRVLLAGLLLQNVSLVMNPWALSVFHGTAATGIWSAGQNIILLANPLVLGFCNFFGPQTAHQFAMAGARGLQALVLRTAGWVMLATVAFTVGIALWGNELLVLMFGPEFAGQGRLVTALVVGEFCEMITVPVTLGLLAMSKPGVLLWSHVIRLAIATSVGLWLINSFGPEGVGWARLASNLGGCGWQWWAFRRLVNDA